VFETHWHAEVEEFAIVGCENKGILVRPETQPEGDPDIGRGGKYQSAEHAKEHA